MQIKQTLGQLVVTVLCLVGSACTVNYYHSRPQTSSASDAIQLSVGPFEQVYGVKVDADAVLHMQLSLPGEVASVPDSRQSAVLPAKMPATLVVQASVTAHVHCYYRQSNERIFRIFPGVFNRDTQVTPGYRLSIPNASWFRKPTDSAGKAESYLCLASSENLEPSLPRPVRTAGYNPVPYRHFDDLYRVYRGVAGANLVGRVVSVEIK